MRNWGAVCFLGLAMTASSFCQTFYGSIVGTVTDPSGSAVPQANAVCTNTGTSERRAAQTDMSGNYQFVNLVPGQYRIEIEKAGFRRFSREPITVEVQSAVRIDVPMSVGDINQVIEVTAQTPLLQTENAALGQVVEARKVLEMPLNGRNVLGLVALVPGVVPGGQSGTTPTGTNIFAWGNYQIGGGQANQSAAYIDGAPINASYANLTALVPTQDAIQEFRVQTNNLGPEFGRLAGGAINLITKSGTSTFHGSAYEFLRNRSLNANTFFNNRAGVQRPAFTQNQYGANLGGPVIKDKTFFFFSWEGFRLRQGASYTYSVPTDAMRAGDFSNVRNSAGAVVPIYDPLTTCGRYGNAACAKDSSGNDIISRIQFPGNIIPLTRLDPASKVLSNLWGHANGTGNQFTNVNNFTANASVGGNNDQYNARIDHSFSDRQHAFLRYTYWTNLNLPIDPYGTKTCVDRCTETFNTNQAVFADNYSFTPTLIFDIRLSYMRFSYDRTALTAGYDLTQLGWPASMNNQVVVRTTPLPNVTGYNGVFSTSGTGSTIIDRNDVYSIVPTLTKIWGSHTLKFGGEFRRNTHNYYQQNSPSGTFSFDSLLTSVNPFAAAGTGNGFASFMLGYGTGGGVTQNNLVAGQLMYRAFYAGDQWQISPRITFNYGLRFEQMGPWSERYDRMIVLLPGVQDTALSKATGLSVVGAPGLVNSPLSPSRNNVALANVFSPRIGLAWRPKDKTVIRGGYGIFWLPNDVVWNRSPNNDATNSFTNPFNGTLDGSVTPADVMKNPFPNGLLPAPGRASNVYQFLWGQGLNAAIYNSPNPYAQQWDLDIQRELPGGMALSLAYAGSKGTHLPGPNQNLDQIPTQYLSLGTKLQEQVANPYYGPILLGSLAQPKVAYGQLLRPYPQYTGFSMANPTNRNSMYHSAQVKLEKRFSQGGTILGAYTWSKLISDTDTLTGWLEAGGGAGGAQDNFNIRAERSLALYDTPHRLVVSYIVDVPVGKGKKLLGNVNSVADRLVSGWGIGGYSTFQSGNPLPIGVASNTIGFGAGQRPNRTGTSASVSGSAQSRLNGWFNTASFSLPAAFTFGNSARTLPDVRSHGIANYDFTVFKNTKITEKVGLQFRAEIFNLFNRVRFAYPGTTVGTPQFGVISGQYNDPRLVQLALRLLF
jgi:hypothetical protein